MNLSESLAVNLSSEGCSCLMSQPSAHLFAEANVFFIIITVPSSTWFLHKDLTTLYLMLTSKKYHEEW